MPPRQSLRARAQRRVIQDQSDEDDDAVTISSAGSEAEDEWQPESSRGKRKRGRGASASAGASSASDADEVTNVAKIRTSDAKKQRTSDSPTDSRPAYDEDVEDEAERERLQREAQEAWEQVRAKKAGGDGGAAKSLPSREQSKTAPAAPAATLTNWLGLPPIPWPTSPASSQIFDRDSLFIGFAYPLESSSPSAITPILNHLTSTVHPSLPSNIFPTAFSHLDPKRRGSSHDMQAYRVLELKRGRNGLGGPNDFGLEEKFDDDGERWAGEKILRVMKELGAVDLLVVVSRWYGGTNLGPIRFEHITKCARETVRAFLSAEAMKPLRGQLVELDREIREVKGKLKVGGGASQSTAESYDGLDDPDKAQRLVNARMKQLEMLKKRLEGQAKGKATPKETPAAVQRESQPVEPPRPTSPPAVQPDADLLQGWDDLA